MRVSPYPCKPAKEYRNPNLEPNTVYQRTETARIRGRGSATGSKRSLAWEKNQEIQRQETRPDPKAWNYDRKQYLSRGIE
jgi:hypothetical protein